MVNAAASAKLVTIHFLSRENIPFPVQGEYSIPLNIPWKLAQYSGGMVSMVQPED